MAFSVKFGIEGLTIVSILQAIEPLNQIGFALEIQE